MSRLNVLLLLAFFISFLKYVAFLNPIKQHSKETMHRRLFGHSSSAFLRPSALSLNCGKQKRKRRYNKTFKMTIQVSTNSDQLGLLLRVMLFFIINKKYLAYKTKLTIDKSKSQLMEGIDPEINEWVGLWSKISYKPTPYIKMFDFGHDIAPTMLSQSLVYTVMNMSRLASYSSIFSVERPISFLQLSEAGFRYSEQENVIVCDGCCMRGNSLMITEGTSPSNAIYHNNGCQYIQEGPHDNRVDVPGSAAPMASNSATQNEDIITSQRSNNALSGISRARSIESLSTVVPSEECPAIGGVNLDTISEVIPTINRADRSSSSRISAEYDSQSFTLSTAGVTAGAASPEAAPTATPTAFSEAADISVFSAHRRRNISY